MTPGHQFFAAWFAFGAIAAVVTLAGAGLPRHHRAFALVFYAALVLSGPITIFLALVPLKTVREGARAARDRLDGLPR